MDAYVFNLSDFVYKGPGHYKINCSNFWHDVYIKKGNQQLIVFGQGAVDKKKPQPNFQRVSWVGEVDETVIISSDPAIPHTSLTLAWFQQPIGINYFYKFSSFLKELAVLLECNVQSPMFYGSSAGGFTSLMISSYFNDAWVVVNNPQTDWTNFHANKVQEVLDLFYGGDNVDVYKSKNPYQSSPLDLYRVSGNLPNLIYLQNRSDRFHYDEHYIPFMSALEAMKPKSKVITYLYDNPSEGHNPLGKKETLDFLSIARAYKHVV